MFHYEHSHAQLHPKLAHPPHEYKFSLSHTLTHTGTHENTHTNKCMCIYTSIPICLYQWSFWKMFYWHFIVKIYWFVFLPFLITEEFYLKVFMNSIKCSSIYFIIGIYEWNRCNFTNHQLAHRLLWILCS